MGRRLVIDGAVLYETVKPGKLAAFTAKMLQIDQRVSLETMELSRYIFEPLRRDDEFILYRSHSRLEEQTSLLLLVPVAKRPPIETIRKIENEYSLRGELGDSWAVKPLT